MTGLCAPGALGPSSGAMNNRSWLRDPGTGPFPEASSHGRSCGSLKIASSLLKWRPNSFSNQKIRSPYKNLQTHAKSFPLLPSCGFLDEKIGKGYRVVFFLSLIFQNPYTITYIHQLLKSCYTHSISQHTHTHTSLFPNHRKLGYFHHNTST